MLTNLAAAGRAPKVVHCLRLRWRQENSFKFLSEHYAIDPIVPYGAEPETQDRLVPNPKRKALQQQVRAGRQRLQGLQAQLGGALDHNPESRRPTVPGLKIAHARLRREIAQQRQVLARLENRLRHTPGRISAAQVDRTRTLLREDRRLVVNALKIAAGNAESMLACASTSPTSAPRTPAAFSGRCSSYPVMSPPPHLTVWKFAFTDLTPKRSPAPSSLSWPISTANSPAYSATARSSPLVSATLTTLTRTP